MKAYERVNAWTKKYGFGLTKKRYLYLVLLYITGNKSDKDFVYELLEDINFHTESALLSEGDYVGAINAANETWHEEDEEPEYEW